MVHYQSHSQRLVRKDMVPVPFWIPRIMFDRGKEHVCLKYIYFSSLLFTEYDYVLGE